MFDAFLIRHFYVNEGIDGLAVAESPPDGLINKRGQSL